MCNHKLDSIKKEIRESNNVGTSRQRTNVRLPRINIRGSNRIVNYDDIVLDRVLRNSLRDY